MNNKLSPFTKAVVRVAKEILTADHPMTLRQVHYAIFSRGLPGYKNDKASYRALSRILTNARRLHRAWELQGWPDVFEQLKGKAREFAATINAAPPDLGIHSSWIVDELRKGERVNVFDNAQEYIEAVRQSYRRDMWQDQPSYCEVWGEKATVLGSLRPIAHKFGLMLRVCRGFGSAGMEDIVGRLFEGLHKPITVFYVGDHDASGVLIERDMHRRAQIASGVDFSMKRLAVLAADIERFRLPPQRIKEKDSRASAFRKEFGQHAATVELEALPVAELKRRIAEAVESLIDVDLWSRQVDVQEVELTCIAEFAERMKTLPQLGGNAPTQEGRL